jgi:hypothetical protein
MLPLAPVTTITALFLPVGAEPRATRRLAGVVDERCSAAAGGGWSYTPTNHGAARLFQPRAGHRRIPATVSGRQPRARAVPVPGGGPPSRHGLAGPACRDRVRGGPSAVPRFPPGPATVMAHIPLSTAGMRRGRSRPRAGRKGPRPNLIGVPRPWMPHLTAKRHRAPPPRRQQAGGPPLTSAASGRRRARRGLLVTRAPHPTLGADKETNGQCRSAPPAGLDHSPPAPDGVGMWVPAGRARRGCSGRPGFVSSYT